MSSESEVRSGSSVMSVGIYHELGKVTLLVMTEVRICYYDTVCLFFKHDHNTKRKESNSFSTTTTTQNDTFFHKVVLLFLLFFFFLPPPFSGNLSGKCSIPRPLTGRE